ncbi:MAG: hypothetical protein AAGC46_16595 [Solirubrobacteraceae bacterium]|nr:hypothetical protein [Patulibacter sp.]
MKIKAPSPAMGVALLALGMASTGSAFAAASYVANAGKVDGRDAVSSQTSTSNAAGKLVATAGSGPLKGQIPAKFLGGVMQGDADAFGHYVPVPDNAGDVLTPIASTSLGTLSVTCADQNAKAGVEDPVTRLVFANTTAVPVDIARTVGNGEPYVGLVQPNTTAQVNIGGSTTFHFILQQQGHDVVFDGVVRQDGRGTADASCLAYGTTQEVPNVR